MNTIHPDDPSIKNTIKEYWDKNSEYYDKHGLGTDEECLRWKKDFQKIFGTRPLKILDVGTGTGFIGLNLAELGHEVTGLDFSEKMMNHARKKSNDRGIPYTFVIGDAEHPDFPDNYFDAVICRYLLWTLPNPHTAFAQWIRVVRPGGKIVVIDGQWKPKGIKQRVCLWMLRFYNLICMQSGTLQIRYGQDLSAVMPNFNGVKLADLVSYFRNHDLSDIQTMDFSHIREIQKNHLPWFLKYAYYHDTYGVWGRL
jgi:ubiquinone/menaquinone biosynthesis C-methylase UbiE